MAMIHDATIDDGVLIGMKAMICESVTIGEMAIIAEHSTVRKQTSIPPKKIAAGSPARVVGNVTKRQRERLALGIRAYQHLIGSYHSCFKLKKT
jgi:phenylacetic acid degradation protein